MEDLKLKDIERNIDWENGCPIYVMDLSNEDELIEDFYFDWY